MSHQYLAFAIPFFLFFMGWEYWYSKKKGKNFFQFAESIANLNVGIAERLMDVFTIVPFFYFFKYIYLHFALLSIPVNIFSWVLLFILTDLVWYWYHRFAHEINILWAAHIVHHQSEDFNYTTSARITVFQAAIRCLFWGILPLFGFPPEMITALLLVHGLYPFFIHTQTIGKLGLIEYVFVTPSHHRVHHSSNPQYLDKNYGDVLIVWDKIFGTFSEEKEKPVYGLTKPIKSHSFLWQHFHYPLELLYAMSKVKGLRAKCKILFGRPDSIQPDGRDVLERRFLKKQTTLQPTKNLSLYIVIQTCITLILLFTIVYFYPLLSQIQIAFTTLFILISVMNTGAILEQRAWIFYLECFRFNLLLVWIWIFYPTYLTSFSLLMVTIILLHNFRPIEKRYKNLLFQKGK
jgi:sterol desaturase/sphingolipid hydroxylase (fatty acid hydroxylase superfamily)